mmetsp:Transcript_36328/g.35213  ORF Transcript_36328/g.35213 Transcript_36328/m.35213 type:complete len:101 (-) Transcript_36328:2001-2303(-)
MSLVLAGVQLLRIASLLKALLQLQVLLIELHLHLSLHADLRVLLELRLALGEGVYLILSHRVHHFLHILQNLLIMTLELENLLPFLLQVAPIALVDFARL